MQYAEKSPHNNFKMKLIIKILLPLLVLAAGAGIAYWLEKNKPEPEKKKEVSQLPSLFVAPVERKTVQLQVSSQGEVQAVVEVDLVSQLSGQIIRAADEFVEGGQFKAGQTLLWIDDADYQLSMKRAQARLAEADVRLEQALADAKVARQQLADTRNPTALALKKPQLAEARANRQAAEADVAQARLNLQRTRISLPFDGRMKSISRNLGSYVTVGTVLARGYATDQVKLRLPLSDLQLQYLGLPLGYQASQEDAREVLLHAKIAGEPRQWRGRLSQIDAAYDARSRVVYATVLVEAPYDSSRYPMPLAVGLFIGADIDGRKLEDALVIDRAALQPGGKVFRVNQKNRLEIVPVRVVYKSPQFAVVDGELAVEDALVISAIRNPVSGMEVKTLQGQSE